MYNGVKAMIKREKELGGGAQPAAAGGAEETSEAKKDKMAKAETADLRPTL